VAVDDTIRVEFVWRMSGIDFAVNVLHFTTGATDPLTQAMVDALGANIETAFTTANMDDQYSTVSEFDRIVARDLRTDGNGPLEFALDRVGTVAANPQPAQTCLVSTLRTTDGSRSGRGRIYWPAMANTLSSATGQALLATTTACNAFVEDLMLIGAGALGNLVLGVYSRVDSLTRSVTSVSTNNTFDVQTRRRDLSIV